MSAVEMSRADAVALVQRIIEADTPGNEVDGWRDKLDEALAGQSGHVSDLVFWPSAQELSPDEVVDQALAYWPIVL
ncbi:e9imm peptide [Streptomyces djakartensis]|uniref:e9imm peptide n=1 Tax=Streptomyces djakartensis TaxID=68193 RepID=UPI0034DFDA2D